MKRYLNIFPYIIAFVFLLHSVPVLGKDEVTFEASAEASPSVGGKVIIGIDATPGSPTQSAVNVSIKKDSKLSWGGYKEASTTFYYKASANANYVFKGWSADVNANSGNTNASYSIKLTGKGNGIIWEDVKETASKQYAIFARMTGDLASGSTIDFGEAVEGIGATKILNVTHAHAGTISLTTTGDFSVSPATINSIAEETASITITFSPQGQGPKTGTLTVSSNNGLSNLTYTLQGVGYAKPSVEWNTNFSEQIKSGEATLSVGDTLRASCVSGQTITYSDYNTDYFSSAIDDAGDPVLVVKESIPGTISNVSVKVNLEKREDTYWAAHSETFTLGLTNLTPQTIVWNDKISDLTNKNLPYTINLTAVAYNSKTNQPSGLPITYTVDKIDYVSVSGNTLTIKAVGGPTTITASVAGNASYAPASVSKIVKVIDVTKLCDTEDIHNNGSFKENNTYTIYPTLPDKLTFNARKQNLLLSKDLHVVEYNGSTELKKHVYEDISYKDAGTNVEITLQPTTTHVVFKASDKATYTYYITDIKTTRRTLCEVDKTSSHYASYPGQAITQTVKCTYANTMIFLSLESGSNWTVNPESFGECGGEGEQAIQVTFSSQTKGEFSDVLYIKNNVGTILKEIPLTASVTTQEQLLESWNIQETYTVADKVTLQAKTNIGKTDFTFSVESSTPADIVQIDGNTMTFKGTGTATIKAYQAGGGLYDAFTTTQTITINKATPTIITPPTASNISYTQTLGMSNLSGGVVTIDWQGNENTLVEGHFQWKEIMLVPSANYGNPQQQTLVFVPTRGDLYNRVECQTTLTVAQINQTLTWNQDLPTTIVEDELIPLTTTVTSGRPISYTFSPDYLGEQATKVVATNPDTLIALQRGKGTVTAACPGDADYKASNAITKNIYILGQPRITWNLPDMVMFNQQYNDIYTITNGDPALLTITNHHPDIAYIENNQLTVLNKKGTATITFTFAGNDEWAAWETELNITPQSALDHVAFTYNEAMFNANTITIQKTKASWDNNTLKLNNGTTNWDDVYVVIKFNGIPKDLSFDYKAGDGKASTGWTDWSAPPWYVEESADGTNWSSIWDIESKSTDWKTISNLPLKPNTRYIKLCYSGNYEGYFRNVTVSERNELIANPTSLDFGNTAKVGDEPTTRTLALNWYNVFGLDVYVEGANANVFKAVTTSVSASPDNYQENVQVTVQYLHTEGGTANAELCISDVKQGGTQTIRIPMTGTTQKLQQTLSWLPNYADAEPVLPISNEPITVAQASSGLEVTYTSSNAAVIEVVNDGKALKVVGSGETLITATQAGNSTWAEATCIQKTFKVTEKNITRIQLTQDLTRLKTTDEDFTLIAKLQKQLPDGSWEEVPEQAANIRFSTQTNNVVTVVNTNQLHVVAEGTDMLYAYFDETPQYEAAQCAVSVRVRVPSVGCDHPIIPTDLTEEYTFFQMNKDEINKVIAIDRTYGTPASFTFKHAGGNYKAPIIGTNHYKGPLTVQESTDGGSTWSGNLYEVTPTLDQYNETEAIELSRNATHIRITRPANGEGYHYIKDVVVLMADYVESQPNAVDFGNVSVGSTVTKEITIDYSYIRDVLELSKTTNELSLSHDAIGDDCGDFGKQIVQVTLQPQIGTTTMGAYNDIITITESVRGEVLQIPVTANVTKSGQQIVWDQATDVQALDDLTINAHATSELPLTYQTSDPTIATVDNNGHVTILQAGTVTFTVSQEGNIYYNPATPVSKEFTIHKVVPTIATYPTASTIHYGQALMHATLTGGAAQDDMPGTFAWTNELALPGNVGIQQVSVTFNPQGQHALFYDAAVFTIPIEVLPAEQRITMLQALPIQARLNTAAPINACVQIRNSVTNEWECSNRTFAVLSSDPTIVSVEGRYITGLQKGQTTTLQLSVAEDANYLTIAPLELDVVVYEQDQWLAVMPDDEDKSANSGENEGSFNMVFAQIDQATLDAFGGVVNKTYTNVLNAESYFVANQMCYMQMVKADIWLPFVAPFDIQSLSVLETMDEALLQNAATKQEAIALQAQANKTFVDLMQTQLQEDALGSITATDLQGIIDQFVNQSTTDRGVFPLVHYDGTNGNTASYYLYETTGTWELLNDKVDITWQPVTKDADGIIMKKGHAYMLQFPYCPFCVNHDRWDYWTGKIILFQGVGTQTIDGTNQHSQIKAQQSNLLTNQLTYTGNATLHDMYADAGEVFVFDDNPQNETYNYFVRNETTCVLKPTQAFVYANILPEKEDVMYPSRVVAANENAPIQSYEQYEYYPKAVSRTGEIIWERRPIRNEGVTTHIERIEATDPVNVYTLTGQFLTHTTLGQIQNTLPNGVYMVRNQQGCTQKVVLNNGMVY